MAYNFNNITQKVFGMAEPDVDLAALLKTAPRPRRWGILAFVALLMFAGAATGFGLWQSKGRASDPLQYQTDPLSRGDLTVSVTATGTVQPTTLVDVSSELAGTLAEVMVDYNDAVIVGQALARLDTAKLQAQVANADAQAAAAKARLAQAEATALEVSETFATQSELSSRGIATRSNMISAEANSARAKAAVDMARADLTLALANLDLAREDLEIAVIRSPINGVVLNRQAEVGQIVGPQLNDPVLFTLAEDLTRMELLADVDEADIGQVAVDQVATFTVDAFDNRTFDATITKVRFASEVTDNVVTYKAVLSVDNPDMTLRPGMTATATITVAQETDVLLAPNAALRWAPPRAAGGRAGASGLAGLILPSASQRNPQQAVGTGRSIYVLRQGAPVEIAVKVGPTDGRMTRISVEEGAEGLAEGDLLITDQLAGTN